MKKLLLTAVLGLTLGLPAVSHAGINIFGVETPVTKSQVNDNISSGYVAGDLGDTFHVQKTGNSESIPKAENSSEKLLVFGVDVNSVNKI